LVSVGTIQLLFVWGGILNIMSVGAANKNKAVRLCAALILCVVSTLVLCVVLCVCIWAHVNFHGGINGLVTVLPAANAAQQGLDVTIGLGQSFAATDLQDLATSLAEQNYADEIAANADYLLNNPSLIEAAKTTILGKYTLHGSIYIYNLSAIIDWKPFIYGAGILSIIGFVVGTVMLVFNLSNKSQRN